MPTKLWEPPQELVESSTMTRYMRWLDRGFTTYDELWRFSVEDLDAFWASIWEFFEVDATYDRVLGERGMPGAMELQDVEAVVVGLHDARHRPAPAAGSRSGWR